MRFREDHSERLPNFVRACRRYATVLLLTLLVAVGGLTNRAYAQTDSCAVNVIHTYMNGRPIQWDSVKLTTQTAGYGSINIFFRQEDTTSNITLSGKTFRVIVGSQTCLPFTEYPVSYSMTFSDSTFYSEPEAFAEYSSSTWHFNGWYKYRYYCDGESGLCICSMDETLPPEDIPSLHCGATAHCYIRHLDALFGGNMVLSKFSPVWGNYDEEWMIVTE